MYPIAIHLEQPERARALYLLTLALGELTPWERERLDELQRLVMDLLDQPDVTGLEARNLVERRRAEALRIVGDDKYIADRVLHARGAPSRARGARHRTASGSVGAIALAEERAGLRDRGRPLRMEGRSRGP